MRSMKRDVFERIVSGHKDRVYTYAAWVLGDVEEAADVTQQALIRLWEHRGQVAEASAGTWLRMTAHRLCMDRFRRRAVRREISLEAFIPGGNGHADHVADIDGHELRRAVAAELSRLEPRDRAILVLRDMDGLSYEQIGVVLAMPLGTLKASLHRARERLRRALTSAGVTGS